MRKPEYADAAHLRPIKAAAIVLAIVLVAPGASVVGSFVKSAIVQDDGPMGIDSAYIVSAPDAYAAVGRIEELVASDGYELPEAFADEVGCLPGARDVRVSGEGTVVGYVVDDDARSVCDRLTAQMEAAGWSAVPLAGEVGATYVKEDGRYTWVLATCTQAGEATSVVMRCSAS